MTDSIRKIKTTHHECHYVLESDSRWLAVGTRTHGVHRGNIRMYKNGELQYSMRQVSLAKQILSNLPGVYLFFHNPFVFFINCTACGHSKRLTKLFGLGEWDFYFGEDTYHISIAPKGIHRLTKNSKEIATYYRHSDGSHEPHDGYFSVEYTSEMKTQPDILLLFGAFVENYINMEG